MGYHTVTVHIECQTWMSRVYLKRNMPLLPCQLVCPIRNHDLSCSCLLHAVAGWHQRMACAAVCCSFILHNKGYGHCWVHAMQQTHATDLGSGRIPAQPPMATNRQQQDVSSLYSRCSTASCKAAGSSTSTRPCCQSFTGGCELDTRENCSCGDRCSDRHRQLLHQGLLLLLWDSTAAN